MKKLDFSQLTEEDKKAIIGDINLTEDAIKDILLQTFEILKSITEPHKKAYEELKNPAIYKAFVEQITAEDLRKEGITEESIADFLNSSIADKKEYIDNLDVFVVYRLYENKANSITAPATTDKDSLQTGYKGIDKLKENIICNLDSITGTQPYTPLKHREFTTEEPAEVKTDNPFEGMTTEELRSLIIEEL